MKSRNAELPQSTNSQYVENLIDWLRDEVKLIDCGKVGLVITVHKTKVVKWEQLKEVTGSRITP